MRSARLLSAPGLLPLGLLALALLVAVPPAAAQAGVQAPLVVGARSRALGGAGVALGGDLWGAGNPAAAAGLARGAVSAYAEQGFGLAALRLGALRAALPTRFGVVTAGGQTFGSADYRVTDGALGLARGFALGTTRRVEAGVALHLHSVAITGYGSDAAATLDLGARANVLPGLDLGVRATNVAGGAVGQGEPLPRSLAVGGALAAGDRLRLVADVEKAVDLPLAARGGVEATLASVLVLRAGATSEPRSVALGVGVRTGRVAADLSAARHEVLGWTPALGAAVRF